MSLSEPLEKGLAQSVCQLCENSPFAQWKCINCDLFMCQVCLSKIHSKIKSSKDHEILDVKDCGSVDAAQKIRKVGLQSMPCITHVGQNFCAFCIDCDKAACMECLIKSHQKHKYKKLNEIYDTIMSEMKELQNKLESCLKFLSNEDKHLEKLLLEGRQNFQETKEEILRTEKKIIETISKNAKHILQELEYMWFTAEKKIKAELSVIQANNNNLMKKKKSLNIILQSHQVSEIFSGRETLHKTIINKSYETINLYNPRITFIAGDVVQKLKTKMIKFGSLTAVPDFEIVRSYQTECINVINIINFDKTTAFIASFAGQTFQKVKFEGNNISIEADFNAAVYDMAKLSNNEILLSTGESELKLYSKDNQIKTIKSFNPLKTTCIHVSNNNKIYLGLTECNPPEYPATKASVRRVVVLNGKCDIQNTYEFDKDNQRLFTIPWRIVTINDNIYVIDTTNNKREGRVIGFNSGGQLLSIYDGCNIDSDIAKFYPSDITVTPTEIILVSDRSNHAIHVLNSAGKVIACKLVKTLGIELPLCLNIDAYGILWIGCTKTTKECAKAKIFCVKIK